jgi:hypothetical protein
MTVGLSTETNVLPHTSSSWSSAVEAISQFFKPNRHVPIPMNLLSASLMEINGPPLDPTFRTFCAPINSIRSSPKSWPTPPNRTSPTHARSSFP